MIDELLLHCGLLIRVPAAFHLNDDFLTTKFSSWPFTADRVYVHVSAFAYMNLNLSVDDYAFRYQ